MSAYNRNLFSWIFFWTIFPALKQKKCVNPKSIFLHLLLVLEQKYIARVTFFMQIVIGFWWREESNACIHPQLCRWLLRIFRHGFVNGSAVTSKNEYNCKDVRTGGGLNAKIYCRRGFKIQSKKILDWDRWIFNFFWNR